MLHRRQYRCVHNNFWHWFQGRPQVSFPEGSLCSPELWALALKQYRSLNRYQKNMVTRHFLDVTGAPDFLLTFAGGQWHVSADDKKATPVAIDSNTALLAYQGNLLVVDAAGLSGALSDEDLTKAVRQLPAVKGEMRTLR